jgi:hypothetical protein
MGNSIEINRVSPNAIRQLFLVVRTNSAYMHKSSTNTRMQCMFCAIKDE